MIYSFLYVLIFSMALILIQKLDMSLPPLFSLLITACIATIYFNWINRQNLKVIYLDCWKNKAPWLSIMAMVLLMWGFTMVGPGLIGASSFNFIYFTCLGMLGFLSLSIKDWPTNKLKLYYGLCIFILMMLDIIFELHNFSLKVMLGVSLAVFGGISSFVYFKLSQKFAAKTNLSATQVLAVRFYLAIIVLFVILPKHEMLQYIDLKNSLYLILLAFFSLIIPLYFSQKALEKITSEQHAIINSLCPVVTAIFQEITFRDLKLEQFTIFLLYSFAILSFYFINNNSKKNTGVKLSIFFKSISVSQMIIK